MNNQKRIADSYLARLQSEARDCVISEALHDRELLVFTPLWTECTCSASRNLLGVFANQIDMTPELEDIVRNDAVLLRKYQMLVVLERFNQRGSESSFDELAWHIAFDGELISLLMEMHRMQIIDIRIDERSRRVRIINVLVPREIRLISAPDIITELQGLIHQLHERFEGVENSLKDSEAYLGL